MKVRRINQPDLLFDIMENGNVTDIGVPEHM